jgi:hypothetical protein
MCLPIGAGFAEKELEEAHLHPTRVGMLGILAKVRARAMHAFIRNSPHSEKWGRRPAQTFTADEREAVCHEILAVLTGFDEVVRAANAKDLDYAWHLIQEYSYYLQVLDALDWNERRDRSFELALPPDVLGPVFRRLRERAKAQADAKAEQRADAQDDERQNRLLAGACDRILSEEGADGHG